MPLLPVDYQDPPPPVYVWQAPQRCACLRIWDLVHEIGIREAAAVWQSAKNYIRYLRDPHHYCLNPAAPMIGEGGVAKVIVLIHGQGGGPFCFLPLAERLQKAEVPNVYTVSLRSTKQDPVPIRQLETQIAGLTDQCLQHGADHVEVCLIGHSLGALVASKYIWREERCNPRTEVTMMVSISGRLRYEECRFSWFCENTRNEIEATYRAYLADPNRALLYTCWGDQDRIVPETSAHVQSTPAREFTVAGYGHAGVISAPQVHAMIATWLVEWRQLATQKACV